VAQHLGLTLDEHEETEAPTTPETEVPTEPETAPETEAPTEQPTSQQTDAPTEAPDDRPADTDVPAEKKGCGAVLSPLSVLLLPVCAAFAMKKTRRAKAGE
jgi:hypothetical protein